MNNVWFVYIAKAQLSEVPVSIVPLNAVVVTVQHFSHQIYFFTSSISVVLILTTLILFGLKKEDREWMPRPDQNYLSWSYGLCCVSGWFSLFAALLFVKASRSDTKDEY